MLLLVRQLPNHDEPSLRTDLSNSIARTLAKADAFQTGPAEISTTQFSAAVVSLDGPNAWRHVSFIRYPVARSDPGIETLRHDVYRRLASAISSWTSG